MINFVKPSTAPTSWRARVIKAFREAPVTTAAVALALASALVLLISWAVVLGHSVVNVPVYDQWDRPLFPFILAEKDRATFSDWIAPHNNGRKTLAYALSYVPVLLFGDYDPRREVVFFFLLFALAAWSIYRLGRRLGLSVPAAMTAPLIMTAAMWGVRTAQLHMFTISFERLPPLIALFAAMGAIFLWRSRRTWLAGGVAALCAFLGTMSYPSGLLLWPLVIVGMAFGGSWRERGPWLVALCLALVGALTVGLYLDDNSFTALSDDATRHDWSAIARFALTFLGAPIRGHLGYAPWIGLVQTIAFFAVTAIAIPRIWRDPAFRARFAPPLLMGAFAFGAAMLAAIGRYELGLELATRPHYVPDAVLLPASVAMMVFLAIPTAVRLAAFPLTTLAVIFIAVSLHPKTWRNVELQERNYRQGRVCAVLWPRVPPNCVRTIYPILKRVPQRIAFQKGVGLLDWVGVPVAVADVVGGIVETIVERKGRVFLRGHTGDADTRAEAIVASIGPFAPDGEGPLIVAPARGLSSGWNGLGRKRFNLGLTAEFRNAVCDLRLYAADIEGARLIPIEYEPAAFFEECANAPSP